MPTTSSSWTRSSAAHAERRRTSSAREKKKEKKKGIRKDLQTRNARTGSGAGLRGAGDFSGVSVRLLLDFLRCSLSLLGGGGAAMSGTLRRASDEPLLFALLRFFVPLAARCCARPSG